jgi:hypothetical protein
MSPSLRVNRRRISFDQPVGYPGAGQIPITRLLGPDRDPQEGENRYVERVSHVLDCCCCPAAVVAGGTSGRSRRSVRSASRRRFQGAV